mmetsp:Transcript_14525/g.27662  ORF Transcript_14525/g.27662 Transcript_14525/m.27662 type:complete len:229 (+) Transcript_14525:898-1584(+)
MVSSTIEFVHMIKNLFASTRGVSVARTSPSIKHSVETNCVGSNVLIALLAQTIHPLENFFSSLRGRAPTTRFSPRIENRVKVDGCWFDVVATSVAVTVHHVLQDAFRTCGCTRFATLGQRINNRVVSKGVGFEIRVPILILGFHLVEEQAGTIRSSAEETFGPRINYGRVGERIRLKAGHARRMEATHGHKHFFRLGSCITLFALGPTINDRVKHVRVGHQIAMSDRI